MSATLTDTSRPPSLSNAVKLAYDTAMDNFFSAVDRETKQRGMSILESTAAVYNGYGEDTADAWVAWSEAQDL